ncbi:4-alpha-D-glucan glucanohydrolase) [Durusdinium trenchii]|uniref:4-alpha-D-glucan glucanohydrolase n=1 Tax=Durusdinium trenchii TaxID=1381693 RepID=A0ABP0JE17_9DINO
MVPEARCPERGHAGAAHRSGIFQVDVLKECQEVLGPSGVTAVQLSPVAEHLVGPQWWVRPAVAERIEGWGARGWDAATPLHFHHRGKEIWGACGVGPETGFLCGSPVTTDCSCCPCDMYGLPDWDLAVKAVEESHARHLEELHRMGVTMLRIDAALYMESDLVSRFLNRFPWDMVYQEWWHELPLPGRTDVFGLYRDLKFMRRLGAGTSPKAGAGSLGRRNSVRNDAADAGRIAEFLDVAPLARSPEAKRVLNVTRGDFYINPNEAVYPTCFHDGRSDRADPAVPTFKNGLAFHQQQLFMLASPFPITVLLWGGYAWRQIDDGPPGCEPGMATPGASPLAEGDVEDRRWVCEHRWQGVAGLIRFRRSCRQPMTESWHSGHGGTLLSPGHVAFRLGGSCFVAIARGAGRWQLSGLATQLPPGRYCDLGSWDGRTWTCVREVVLGPGGRVLEGGPACPQGNQCGGHAAHTES